MCGMVCMSTYRQLLLNHLCFASLIDNWIFKHINHLCFIICFFATLLNHLCFNCPRILTIYALSLSSGINYLCVLTIYANARNFSGSLFVTLARKRPSVWISPCMICYPLWWEAMRPQKSGSRRGRTIYRPWNHGARVCHVASRFPSWNFCGSASGIAFRQGRHPPCEAMFMSTPLKTPFALSSAASCCRGASAIAFRAAVSVDTDDARNVNSLLNTPSTSFVWFDPWKNHPVVFALRASLSIDTRSKCHIPVLNFDHRTMVGHLNGRSSDLHFSQWTRNRPGDGGCRISNCSSALWISLSISIICI